MPNDRLYNICTKYQYCYPKSKGKQWGCKISIQLRLCLLLWRGSGTILLKSRILVEKAAEQGNADAQSILSFIYYIGEGVEQSYSQAVYWLKKAAEQGDAVAQSKLGVAYYNGEGVEQSNSQAVYWWKKAAEQENALAQYILGATYYYGKGVEQSNSQALYWLRKACNNQNDGACNLLNMIK